MGLALTDTTNKLGLKANAADVYAKAQADTLLSTKEPAFITVNPILKNLNFENGAIDLMLSSDFTDSANAKTDEAQVRSLIDAYDPYTVESPLEKGRIIETGEDQLRMDNSYYDSLDAKADVAVVNYAMVVLQNYTDTKLLAILRPSNI